MFRLIMCRPTERERTECLIKAKLRNIMMFQDLENITSKEVFDGIKRLRDVCFESVYKLYKNLTNVTNKCLYTVMVKYGFK